MQQLAEERAGEHRALAAERGAPPAGLFPDRGGVEDPRPGRTRAHRGPCRLRRNRFGAGGIEPAHRSAARRGEPHPGERDRHRRHRSTHQRCSGFRHRPADRLRAAVLLRRDQPHRGSGIHRYVHRVSGIALWQVDGPFRRLHQLPAEWHGVRAVRRCAAQLGQRAFAHPRGQRLLLRVVPAGGGTGAARARYAALRPHEADGAHRSANRPAAVRGGAVTAGESAGRQLQPGGLPESHAIPGTGARVPHDSGAGARRVRTLWADPPQYVHQRAGAAHPDAATSRASAGAVRRTDLRRRRLCGIHRYGGAGRKERRRACSRARAGADASGDGPRVAVRVHIGSGRRRLPAGEHHLRSSASAR